MRILFPCFLDLYRPQKSLEGIRLVRRPYPKSDLKFKEKSPRKKLPTFLKNGAKWIPAGSRNPPKIYKISNKSIGSIDHKEFGKTIGKSVPPDPSGTPKIKQNHCRVCQKSKVALSGFSWFKVSFLTSFWLHFLGAWA